MRQTITQLQASKIREVANAGLGRTDVLAFWFGESDEVTPDFIRQAAIDSLQQGETFYAHNLGLPELRAALANTMTQRHGAVTPERIAVTSGGVNGLMLAMQALVNPGDQVLVVTPVWPNLTTQPLDLFPRVPDHCSSASVCSMSPQSPWAALSNRCIKWLVRRSAASGFST